MRKKLFGLIYLSSYKIQLYIVDLKDMSKLEQVDSPSLLQKASKFATYEASLSQIAEILYGFKRKLAEYHVQNYKIFGNRQLLGQLNARYLKDQLLVRTGLKMTWLNASQVAYYKVIAGIDAFEPLKEKNTDQITYLLSLGSAMINLSLFKGPKFASSWSLALGPEELEEINEVTSETAIDPLAVMADYVDNHLGHVRQRLLHGSQTTFIIQHSKILNQNFLNGKASPIQFADFDQVYAEAAEMPNQFLAQKYDLDPNTLAAATPQLVMIKKLLRLTQAEQIFVTDQSVITGLLIQEAIVQGFRQDDFKTIIRTSAQNMANRYLVDQAHTQTVTKFALHLFDRLKKVHMLDEKARQWLEIACTVNDIGNFIDLHRRHHHSAYILEANQLIGLSDRENEIIAEIARYQSDLGPQQDERHYRHLDPQIQMIVAKLAGIARLASSLDISRGQKIKRISVSLKAEKVIITAFSSQDLTLERWALYKKAQLFEEVFGVSVILKQRRKG